MTRASAFRASVFRAAWRASAVGRRRLALGPALCLLALCLLLAILGSRVAAADEPVLHGIASLAAPVAGGAIRIFDGSDLVQGEPYHRFYNGTFAIPLNRAAADLLASRRLRLEIAVDPNTRLRADLGAFDPRSRVLFVNPLTTIVAAYRDLEPVTLARARESVMAALDVGSAASFTCQSNTGGFTGRALLSAGAGGFGAYVQRVAHEVVDGDAPNLRGAFGVPRDFGEFFLDTAAEIFGEAFGGFPGAKPLGGWILGQIFKATDESAAERQEIKAELSNISDKLDQVLEGISQLSTQIADVEKTITDLIKLTNYQNDAAVAYPVVPGMPICSMVASSARHSRVRGGRAWRGHER